MSYSIMDINELPKDPAMLMSYINTKLRDVYSSLDDLCNDLHIDRTALEKRLAVGGFEYSQKFNKFW